MRYTRGRKLTQEPSRPSREKKRARREGAPAEKRRLFGAQTHKGVEWGKALDQCGSQPVDHNPEWRKTQIFTKQFLTVAELQL